MSEFVESLSGKLPPQAFLRGETFAAVLADWRAERTRLLLMRACTLVLLALVVVCALWVTPWLPLGPGMKEYSGPLALAVLLSLLTGVFAVAYALVWAPQFKNEPASEFLRALLGSRRLVRGPGQFYHRLEVECGRARQDRRQTFTLLVVRIGRVAGPPTDLSQLREAMAIVVRTAVRADDIVGDSGADEVWLLALGARSQATPSLVGRLTRAFEEVAQLPEGAPFQTFAIGAASFGQGGEDARTLLEAARRELAVLPARVRAAS